MSLICVADMQPGSFASENVPGISNAIAARAATVLASINPPGPHDLSGFSGMPLDWLGGLDSNQDNQIQNLMYCQLYDLPTGAEEQRKRRRHDPLELRSFVTLLANSSVVNSRA